MAADKNQPTWISIEEAILHQLAPVVFKMRLWHSGRARAMQPSSGGLESHQVLGFFFSYCLLSSASFQGLLMEVPHYLFLLFLANRLLLNMSLRWSLFSHVVIHSQFSL